MVLFAATFGTFAKGGSNVGDNKWSLGAGVELLDFYSPMDHTKFKPFKFPYNMVQKFRLGIIRFLLFL